jgi:fibronectin type 3 domain-containing protein
LAFLLCAGCGYVGPVLPPSPELPNPITDLKVVERGDQLVINFSTPVQTTDGLPIKRFSEVDLRIGPAITPFDFDQWAATATQYHLPLPAIDADSPKPVPVSKSVPAADWEGKRIAVLVRTAVKKTDHYSQWSNREVLDVVPALEQPVLAVTAVKQGYMLTWKSAPNVKYRILRQGPGQTAQVEIGTADASPYMDDTAQWDTRYTYTAIAQQEKAESLPSEPVTIIHANTFPPSAPQSLAALGGPESIELSWSRNAEPDLKGYYVYRSVDGGPFERLGDLTNVPTYSDRKVEHGKTYRYVVTAVTQNGYESDKSPVREVVF